MIQGIHFLLTYACNLKCDHCFVYSEPNARGTFKLSQLREIFHEIAKMKTIKMVYFEGGEPFLFYPLMREGIKMARDMGIKTGIVTNAYWALSDEDAELWLEPLREIGVSDLSISNDSFHYEDEKENPAGFALSAAKRLGMSVTEISIEKPADGIERDKEQPLGEPVVGGNVMLRGRAVEKLTEGIPKSWWEKFTECPYEDLKEPRRVHIDPYGYVHVCQGLIMGNMWDTPLSKLVQNYDAHSHPICGPLVRGGPVLLAREYNVEHDDKYADACHLCYSVRLSLLDRFPEYLAPRQVYGLE
ncbi:MAG: radical SAM protein [Thermoplasmata archaeon]|nr:radical SAM protein [Thermoplasmata archaeon]